MALLKTTANSSIAPRKTWNQFLVEPGIGQTDGDHAEDDRPEERPMAEAVAPRQQAAPMTAAMIASNSFMKPRRASVEPCRSR